MCLSVLLSTASTVHAMEKPNIIVFLVDDMGPMDTSVPFMTDDQSNAKRYPLNDYYRTPGMERLAAQGLSLIHISEPTRPY